MSAMSKWADYVEGKLELSREDARKLKRDAHREYLERFRPSPEFLMEIHDKQLARRRELAELKRTMKALH